MADRDRISGARANARVEAIVARQRLNEQRRRLDALARAMQVAAVRPARDAIVVCLSGRGDKDAAEIQRIRGLA